MSELVYKICTREAWAHAASVGVYRGSADDARDGFIHFSTAAQLAGTAAKHFGGQTDLVLVAVPVTALGDALRFEQSRGGALFPHLYGPLRPELAVEVAPLPWDEARGVHVLPVGILTP